MREGGKRFGISFVGRNLQGQKVWIMYMYKLRGLDVSFGKVTGEEVETFRFKNLLGSRRQTSG